MNSPSSTFNLFQNTKNHYAILDGLRGIAAIMVVAFHLLETHATSHFDQIINHGYLAVDFFYVLSGFVVAYAYDDRWGSMSVTDFFKRRFIRLHPMVVLGMFVGAICFYFQAGVYWPGINQIPYWKTILVMLIGFTLLPLPISWDIRGWQEMYPLNGPGWSLFFEYLANFFYAIFIRKFSNKALSILVFLAACVLIHFTLTNSSGDVIGGWSLDPAQLRTGFTRLMYPFFAGVLLSRIMKTSKVKHSFLMCSLVLVLILAMPRIGGKAHIWMNGLYDSFSIIFLFPLLVYWGANAEIKGANAIKVTKFLGDISYPIYITHYPLIYIYTAWVSNHKIALKDAWPVALLVWAAAIALAYICLKLYDIPVRKWLTRKMVFNLKK